MLAPLHRAALSSAPGTQGRSTFSRGQPEGAGHRPSGRNPPTAPAEQRGRPASPLGVRAPRFCLEISPLPFHTVALRHPGTSIPNHRKPKFQGPQFRTWWDLPCSLRVWSWLIRSSARRRVGPGPQGPSSPNFATERASRSLLAQLPGAGRPPSGDRRGFSPKAASHGFVCEDERCRKRLAPQWMVLDVTAAFLSPCTNI